MAMAQEMVKRRQMEQKNATKMSSDNVKALKPE
jgi:hypothetical protein